MYDDDRHVVLCTFRCTGIFVIDIVPLVVDGRGRHVWRMGARLTDVNKSYVSRLRLKQLEAKDSHVLSSKLMLSIRSELVRRLCVGHT